MADKQVLLCGANVGEYKPSEYRMHVPPERHTCHYKKRLIHPITEKNAIKKFQFLIEPDDEENDNKKNVESSDDEERHKIFYEGYNEAESHELTKEIIAMHCHCQKSSCNKCEKQKKITMDSKLPDQYRYNNNNNNNNNNKKQIIVNEMEHDDDDDDDNLLWLQTFNQYRKHKKKRKVSKEIIATDSLIIRPFKKRKLSDNKLNK